MDFSKYPVEKLLYFVAGVIPGFAALLIYQLASPTAFQSFFNLGFLGYRTKLGVVLLVAFIVGNSMTRLLAGILGAIGGVYGSEVGRRFPESHKIEIAPWRGYRWRQALKRHLGPDAPRDTILLLPGSYELKMKMADLKPTDLERLAARDAVELEKLNLELDDSQWSQWYRYYHNLVLQPADRDILYHLHRGLGFNLEATAVYVLFSSVFVPAVRHWWWIAPSVVWFLVLIAEEYTALANWTNLFSTVETQIRYLSDLPPRYGESRQAGAGK